MSVKPLNTITVEFQSKSSNEGLARVIAAAFVAQLDPTLDEVADVRTAVSEAVTNSIIHGYEGGQGIVRMECTLYKDSVEIIVSDKGKGIGDIEQARQPLYTSRPDLERSGMGFTIMETFMDRMEITSKPGEGTTVTLFKLFGSLVRKKDTSQVMQ